MERQEIFESFDGVSKRRLLGLQAEPAMYGKKEIPYIRPSRYYVGTSSSRSYRRCKRKWGFQSSFKLGLDFDGGQENIHFWFGSAIHFAMEDYFGWNRFGDPRRAFKAYYEAHDPVDRPNLAEEHYELGMGMLEYFMEWYPIANKRCGFEFETAWFHHNAEENTWKPAQPFEEGAIPGTEVDVLLNIGLEAYVDPKTGRMMRSVPGGVQVPIHFHGTIDRICVDMYGRYWLLDYKTAKGADTNKLDTDDQISRYCWAAEQYLGIEIEGFIYLQLTKAVPKEPRVLKNGNLSTDKKQSTTYKKYYEAVCKHYGQVPKAPAAVQETLQYFLDKLVPEGDSFIRWDFVKRNVWEKAAMYHTVIAEASEMIDPNNYLLPNPTRDCIWDCPFREACLCLDRGDMEGFDLALMNFHARQEERSEKEPSFIKKIKWPAVRPELPPTAEELGLITQEFNIILPEKEEE